MGFYRCVSLDFLEEQEIFVLASAAKFYIDLVN